LESQEQQVLDQKQITEIKIPDIVVPAGKHTDSQDEVDSDGFVVVHVKKERKRTRTLSLKSVTEAVKEAQLVDKDQPAKTSVESLVEEPEVIQSQAQVAKVEVEAPQVVSPDGESSSSTDQSNFRVKASKSPSVPVAEDCKPPDPHWYLRLERFWINKPECEDAEVQWQTLKAKKKAEKEAEAKPTSGDDDDNNDPKRDGRRKKDDNDDDDKPSKEKKTKETFSTVDSSSDHPRGKGNWTDESTYLKLDPVVPMKLELSKSEKLELSESESSESELCDSGYSSLKRGAFATKLAFEDNSQNFEDKKSENLNDKNLQNLDETKLSPESTAFKV
jgi:hypothetical protein